jgi:KTSC domain
MNLSSAISAGFTIKQILNFLGDTFPELGNRMKDAHKAGKSADEILKYLSKVDKSQFKKYVGKSRPTKIYPEESSVNPYIAATQAQKNYDPTPESLKTAAKVGLSAAGAYGVSKILPKAIQGIAGLIKSPDIGPKPMSNAPVQPQQASTPQISNTQQTPTLPQQSSYNATPPSITPENSISVIEQMGIGPQIQTLQSAGNTTEAISAAIGTTMKPHQRKWLDEQIKAGKSKPLADLITDYLGQSITQPETAPIAPESRQTGEKQPEVIKEQPKLKPQKGELVATPSGEVGELKDIKNTEGLVEEDGKLHKTKLSDLKAPGESEVEVVERLLEIPEIDKSGPLSYWTYDDQDNELFVMFHNGESYKYLDVPEEIIDQLEKASVIPKGKGINKYGAWSPEQKPEFSPQAGKEIVSRGATLSNLIITHQKYKKPKKGEPPNPFYRKLRKGYDYWTKLRS